MYKFVEIGIDNKSILICKKINYVRFIWTFHAVELPQEECSYLNYCLEINEWHKCKLSSICAIITNHLDFIGRIANVLSM